MRFAPLAAIAAAAALTLSLSVSAKAQTTASYFLVDFNDGASYLFQYDFAGTSTTEIAQIEALQANVPGFTPALISSGGDIVAGLTYAGNTDYSNFEDPTNPLNENGYWGSFISSDGINWNYAQNGVDDQNVDAADGSLYNAFVWQPGYNTTNPSALPSAITADVNATAPEPDALALLASGVLCGGIFITRRRCAVVK